jgi:hypothetical protein
MEKAVMPSPFLSPASAVYRGNLSDRRELCPN